MTTLLFFPTLSLLAPMRHPGASVGLSTQIGAETAAALSVEEKEKATYIIFGGLSVEETAGVLRVSPITVMREWKSAKAWLYRELAGPTANGQ
jgi:DNA-directed RNA polymerase specialized sigma24 family protein